MGLINRSSHWVVRLAQRGCTNRPFYLIVIQKNRSPRDRKIKEQIGTYDPLPNIRNEKLVAIDFDRLRYWLANGAKTSMPVSQLLGLAGYFPIHPSTRLQAHRIRREQEAELLKAKQEENVSGEQATT